MKSSVSLAVVIFLVIVSRGSCVLTGEQAIRNFFAYFRQEEPRGIPVLDLPEPMELFSPLDTVPVSVINGTLLGHSELFLEKVYIDFVALTGNVNISAPQFEIGGQYTWDSFFSTSEGELNSTVTEPSIYTNFSLSIDDDEILAIEGIDVEIDYLDVYLDMTNLLFEQELLLSTGLVESFFDTIVVAIVEQLEPYILEQANSELRNFLLSLPTLGIRQYSAGDPNGSSMVNSKGALSLFLRKLLLFLKLDPIRLPSKNMNLLGLDLKATNIILEGASLTTDIKRLFAIYEDKSIYMEIMLTYPRLRLFYTIAVRMFFIDRMQTYEQITLNDVQLHVKLTVDPTQQTPPRLLHLGLDVGSFGKKKNRNPFHSLVHKVYDLVLTEILNALSDPIRNNIQGQLNRLNLEQEALNFLNSG